MFNSIQPVGGERQASLAVRVKFLKVIGPNFF